MESTWQFFTHLRLYWITFLLLTLSFSALTASDQFRTKKFQNYTYQTLTTPIILSKNDKRQYEGLILSNQLEVLLISDKEVDKSAAALDVKVGYQSDPKSLPGLAHFCEHLMFMGNEKYPEEGEFLKYIKNLSGYINAVTFYENTEYVFEVSNDALKGALDRLSQLFVSPLFKEDSVSREVQVVNSEYKLELQEDEFRIGQVLKLNSNPDYPYSYFPTGNVETLSNIPKSMGIDVRKELIKFYKSHYSSNIMKLVIIGKVPISKLREMMIPRFSQIPNRNLKTPAYPGKPFTQKNLGIQINIVPVENISNLVMEFLMPSQQGNYESRPIRYLTSLLSHEGPGSLTFNLKQRGWVSRSFIGFGDQYTKFFLFRIGFDLTLIGYSHSDEIIKMTFKYLKLIKERGISKNIFDKIKATQVDQFHDFGKEESVDYASSLATLLQFSAPMSQIISSKHIITNYNSSLIQRTFQFLNPKNVRVILVSPSVKKLSDLKKEPNYGTQFSVNKIESEILKDWENVKLDPSLKLPEFNPSIQKNIDLVKTTSESKFPILLKNQTGQILWYTTGDLGIPKVSLMLIIKNNQWFQSLEQNSKLNLFKAMILEDLNSIDLMTLKVELNCNVAVQYPGIAIKVEGISDKADKLMTTIVDRLRNFNMTQGIFNLVKEDVVQDLMSFKSKSPNMNTDYYHELALRENSWANDQLADVTNRLTINDVIKFQRQSINRGSLELMVVGNFNVTQSHDLLDKIQSILKLQTIELKFEYLERAVIIPNNTNLIYTTPILNKDETESAIGFYLDMYAYPDAQQRAIVRLIAQMIQQPAFHQLRIKEQLGYLVRTGVYSIAARGGITIIVQSERDPSYLESRIEFMLKNFVRDTTKITEDEFRTQVKSLKSELWDQRRDLNTLSNFYWGAIISGYADFNRDDVTLQHLESLTRSQFIQVVHSMISPSRRKLSIHLLAHNTKATIQLNGTIIPDLLEWRHHQPLSEYPRPLQTIHTTDDFSNAR